MKVKKNRWDGQDKQDGAKAFKTTQSLPRITSDKTSHQNHALVCKLSTKKSAVDLSEIIRWNQRRINGFKAIALPDRFS